MLTQEQIASLRKMTEEWRPNPALIGEAARREVSEQVWREAILATIDALTARAEKAERERDEARAMPPMPCSPSHFLTESIQKDALIQAVKERDEARGALRECATYVAPGERTCMDGNCIIEKPKGVHTNGGCQHLKGEPCGRTLSAVRQIARRALAGGKGE